jgi:hypothetical protein
LPDEDIGDQPGNDQEDETSQGFMESEKPYQKYRSYKCCDRQNPSAIGKEKKYETYNEIEIGRRNLCFKR